MKLFKDQNGNTFAYEADGSQDHLIGENLIAITQEEEISLNQARADQAFSQLSYGQKRITEYPPIGDQLDALFHAGAFPADMAAKIQAVKEKYPK